MATSTISSTNIKMALKCLILFNEQSKRTNIQGTQSTHLLLLCSPILTINQVYGANLVITQNLRYYLGKEMH